MYSILNNLPNFDLLTVGLSMVGIAILGFLVLLNDRKNITNLSFFIFSILTIAYGIFNYLNYQVKDPFSILLFIRLTVFFAVWHAFSLFQLFYVFPKDRVTFPLYYKLIALPGATIVSILTLTPFVFSGIDQSIGQGLVSRPVPGSGIALFVLSVCFFVGGGIYFLFKKSMRVTGIEQTQYRLIFTGTIVTFSLIIVFNLVFPVFFSNVQYVPFAPVFILPFIIFTAYAIVKHHLFNVRVIATELFIFALWITLLFITFNGHTTTDVLLHVTVLVATIVLGIFLIRSVLQEVRTREKMSQLALDLEITNQELKRLDEAKSDFISIASHQLRTPLSIIKGYMSMIREGTYGKVDSKLEDPIHKIYVSNERLINLVSDLLDLSRMERGKMLYEFQPIRLGDVAEGIVKDFEKVAKDKGLRFTWSRGKMNDLIKGDANKLRQIVLNLVDNAIKYTAKGSLHVEITSVPGGKIAFSVTDTGPGLTPEEAHALFQKFSRGQQESKSHTEGLGLGLYVAKLIAQAHGGELSVTSPGKGKGSTFSLILPLYNESAENFKKFAGEI